jgi:nitroimidazol reductase NimA-like FMN-containing flavoprotein (pyridoxamine 5'-phosphate oxidase superfamily)
MFKKIRNSKRQLEDTDISRILEEGEYGILATIGENQYPYTTPLSYVYLNNAIYFHCAPEGHKLDNIRFNNKVSFCVVGKTKVLPAQFSTIYESAVIFGNASIVTECDEKNAVLISIIDKYSPEFKKEGLEYINKAVARTNIVKITIAHATAKGRLK